MSTKHNTETVEAIEVIAEGEKATAETAETAETEATTVVEFTPYGAAKLANTVLAEMFQEAGAEFKPLPPQMFYNYTTARVNKGQKPLIPMNGAAGKIVLSDLQAWIEKYAAKKLNTAVEVVEVAEAVEA